MPPNKNNDIFDAGAMMKAIQDAFNGILQQGLKPDTILMHPDTWKDIQDVCSGVSMGATVAQPANPMHHPFYDGPTAEEIVMAQPMTGPSAAMLWNIKYPIEKIDMEFKVLEPVPVVLKNRWEDILDE